MSTPTTSSTGRQVLAAVLLAVLAGTVGYGLATWRAQGSAHADHAAPGASAATAGGTAGRSAGTDASGRKVLYWYDPMKPDARFDKPGKSPFMDMQLVPRYADEAGAGGVGGAAGVQVDPRTTQSLGVRLVPVTRESIGQRIEAPGTLGFDERNVAIVQTRTAGFVERVYARAPGDVLAAGAPLADVLVPEWAGAQQEYLAVRATGQAELAAAARQRLLLLGMPEALVADVERSGKAQPLQTIRTPQAGVVQELMVRAGMSLAPGMTLARIGGLGTVWLDVAVPEVHAGLLATGQAVTATLPAFPGETFNGRIAAVLPEAARETRSLRVRIELPNRSGRLKAGMAALATLSGPAQPALVVPSEAVIRTGQRALVYVAGSEPGRYTPVPVELGRELGGKLEVLKGLSEGQQVVASGQFLIDSEASLSGALARAVAPASAPAAAAVFETRGVVEGIDPGELTLQHEPVPALKWPAMSMPFALKTPQLAQGLKVGDSVRFSFSQDANGVVVESISKLPNAAAQKGAAK
jgi:Cu(I)/Ag(I) efflux system membrane fusion protein